MVSTYFALLAEFGTQDIPLTDICSKYFGLNEKQAKQKATMRQLPIPCYRGGSQKSPWLCNAKDLADFIDKNLAEAREEWEKSQTDNAA